MRRTKLFRATVLAFACTASMVVAAQADMARPVDIPAGDLVAALRIFVQQSGVELIYRADQMKGARTSGAHGNLVPRDALALLLKDSGYTMTSDESGAIVITKAPTTPPPQPKPRKAATPVGANGDATKETAALESVVVVGSRLAAASPGESIMPVKLITREEIDRSGASNIAQVLSYLPEVSVNNAGDNNIGNTVGLGFGDNAINATTVQLRGLPAGTTLILINGRRAGESSAFVTNGQFDLSTIPLSMVERIEVLTAGASAVYGGDGLAGAVNIVLRRGVTGLEIRARHSYADGYSEDLASIFWGKSWAKGDITATATWKENGSLTSSERELTADQDFRRFGGDDYRSASSNPGNVYSFAGCAPSPSFCFTPLSSRGNLPGVNSPYATVPAGQDGTSLTPEDFAATAGTLNRSSSDDAFFSPEKSYSLALNGNWEVTPSVELFSELAYTKREIPAVELALTTSAAQFRVPSAVMPASNPFNPFGVDIGVDYRFEDTGIFRSFDQTYMRATIGARGQWRRWEWEVASWWSQDRAKVSGSTGFDLSKFQAALNSTDPATALNLLVGDGSAPASPEVMRSLLNDPGSDDSGSNQQALNGYIRGPIFKVPAGEVTALIGAEYSRQSVLMNPDDDFGVDGGDTSRAIFGEVRVPLLAGKATGEPERVVMTGAFRRQSSGRFEEDATSETLGLQVRPTENLMFRATYSTAFRPLVVFTANLGTNSFPIPVSDPDFGGQYFFPETKIGGGVPEGLRPETSTSRTIGIVYTPFPDWRISASYWDNHLKDRITTVQPQFLVDNEPDYPTRVIRDPATGVITLIDDRSINVSLTEVSGVDFGIDGRWHTRYGDFVPSIAATYTLEHKEQITPSAEVQDNLAVRRDTGWSPRWKIVPRLGWDLDQRVYATLTGRYISPYRDPQPLSNGPDAGKFLTLGNFWLLDLNFDVELGRWLGWQSKWLADTRLNVGVNNLTNSLPEFCNSCGISGYDATQYDVRGRFMYVELRFGL